MPPLANPKHEAFANMYASGTAPGKAYLSAGYSAKSERDAAASASRLLKNANMLARVEQLQAEHGVRVPALVVAALQVVENDLMTRVGRAKDIIARIGKLKGIVLERAAYYSAQPYASNMPGASSGHIVARHKMIGSGKDAERTIEFELDSALLKELGWLENQLAVELGQRVDKNPGAAYSSLREVPAETLEQWRQEAAAAAREAEAAAKALPTDAVN